MHLLHFSTLRRRLAVIACAWLALAPVQAAEHAPLAPGLVLEPPQNISMDYQVLEALGGKPALVGYVEGKPAYFIGAEALNAGIREGALWGKLEVRLRSHSDTRQLEVLAEGGYQTQQGWPVHYRIYRYSMSGSQTQQAFHLLKGESTGYWIYVTAVEAMDLQALLPMIKAVVRRAELTNAQ